jgi:hypothetical protein
MRVLVAVAVRVGMLVGLACVHVRRDLRVGSEREARVGRAARDGRGQPCVERRRGLRVRADRRQPGVDGERRVLGRRDDGQEGQA